MAMKDKRSYVLTDGRAFYSVVISGDGFARDFIPCGAGHATLLSENSARRVMCDPVAALVVPGIRAERYRQVKNRHASKTAMETCERATMNANAASDHLHAVPDGEASSCPRMRERSFSRPCGVMERINPLEGLHDSGDSMASMKPAFLNSESACRSPLWTSTGGSDSDARASTRMYWSIILSLVALILAISAFFMVLF